MKRNWSGLSVGLCVVGLFVGLSPGCDSEAPSPTVNTIESNVATVLHGWQQWLQSPAAQGLSLIPGTGDFDNDAPNHRVDIAVYKPCTSTRAGRIWIGKNMGTSFSFCSDGGAACIGSNTQAWATLGTCLLPGRYQFYTGQFGGDSKPDIVVYDSNAGSVKALINNGSFGNLSAVMATTDPAAGWKLIAGDFSGDSLSDVMVYYQGDGTLFVGRNTITSFAWSLWGTVAAGAPEWKFYPGKFTNGLKADILAFRPPPPPDASGSCTPTGPIRVGRNTGSSFLFDTDNWHNLTLGYPSGAPCASSVQLVVANFTGTPTPDVGVHYATTATVADFKVLRNADKTFLESPDWADLVPENNVWQFNTGDVIAAETSANLTDLIAYYPNDGTFWVAENRGPPPIGYAWPPSVAPGETLNLYTSGTLLSGQPNVIFNRVTTNASGVLVAEASPTASRTVSSAYQAMRSNGLLPYNGPQWSPNIPFTIPQDWIPGFYTATLKAQAGAAADFQITFVVKPAANLRHRTALIANTNTWNAYNRWGITQQTPGGGKYFGETGTTFMRPNPSSSLLLGLNPAPSSTCQFTSDCATGLECRSFGLAKVCQLPFPQTHLAHAEVWAYSAIESLSNVGRGNVDVYSDLDFHNNCDANGNNCVVNPGVGVGKYDRLIITTHPEYWSTQMYDNLKRFLDRGGRVIYLGGNGIFESTSFITAPLGGTALEFLGAAPDETTGPRVRYLFRVMDDVNGLPQRPERKLLGVATNVCGGNDPYVIKNTPTGEPALTDFNSILCDVGLPNQQIGAFGLLGLGASGHEIDKVEPPSNTTVLNQVQCNFPNPLQDPTPPPPPASPDYIEVNTTPANIVRIAEGKLTIDEQTAPSGGADITFYRHPGGGFVFSVGSINFGQSLFTNTQLQRMVENVLNDLPVCHP